jgi:hypothetical protein
MSTWEQLLSDTRIDLKDTSAQKRWSDDMLFLWVKDAITDFSQHFPHTRRVALLAAEDEGYLLPEDYIRELLVETPSGTYLGKRVLAPNSLSLTQTIPSVYYIQEDRLYLNGETDDEVYLTYEALHEYPKRADDLSCRLTITRADEELIRLYIKAKAAEQTRTQQSNLDRFRPGSGDRQDNPMEPENRNLMEAYHQKIFERVQGQTLRIRLIGRT